MEASQELNLRYHVSETSDTGRVVIKNFRIFDGYRIYHTGAREIDGHDGILIPGLIDAHVHLHGGESLRQLCAFGVTTGLDMVCWPPSLVQSLRGREELTGIRSPGIPAIAPGSSHSHIPGISQNSIVTDAVSAASFVADRVAEGSDYIKIVSDTPGIDQSTLNALATFAMAQDANVNILTHVPLDKELDKVAVDNMVTGRCVSVHTLTMMKGITSKTKTPSALYANVQSSVGSMYRAGVPILARMDANAEPGPPANVRHSESIHEEVELLVEAGLSNLDALRAATSLPTKYFDFNDQSVIKLDNRADLVLVSGNP